MGLLDGGMEGMADLGVIAGLLSGRQQDWPLMLQKLAMQKAMQQQQAQEMKMRQESHGLNQEQSRMQIDQLKRQQADQDALRNVFQRNVTPGQPQMLPTDMETPSGPAGRSSFNMPGLQQGLMAMGPAGLPLLSTIQGMNAKNYQKLGEGESLIDVNNPTKPIATGAPKLPAGMRMGPNGPEYIPAYLEGQKGIRASGATRVNVNNAQETEFNKKIGGKFAEQFDGLLTGAGAANNQLRDLQRFQNITAKVPTGKMEPLKAEVSRLASSLGVKFDDEKLKTMGFQDALESMSNQFALTLRNPEGGAGMPGALSDKDREFLVSMVPTLSKTPQGNALIIEGFKRVAQRKIEVAKLAREYKARTGKFDEGFFDVLEQKFGGQDLLGDLHAQAGSIAAPSAPAGRVRRYNTETGAIE